MQYDIKYSYTCLQYIIEHCLLFLAGSFLTFTEVCHIEYNVKLLIYIQQIDWTEA